MPSKRKHKFNAIPAPIKSAVLDQSRVSGVTHTFYRYPARFSPIFARTCIEQLSRPGDVVLDPYMGGGTTIIEAMLTSRRAIGTDLNELAVFVARVKATPLSRVDQDALAHWADAIASSINCHDTAPELSRAPRNMHLPEVRWLRKLIAIACDSIEVNLPSQRSRDFARCVVLNVGQWALNGRRRIPNTSEFRARITSTTHEMLAGMAEFKKAIPPGVPAPVLHNSDVEKLPSVRKMVDVGPVDLVVTSPPYPGVHMLYHRWQVDGRKETDAPYWISGTRDGQGSSFYNFADRRRGAENQYYERATRAFGAIRQVMRDEAMLAQLVAFSDPERQLPRYLRMLQSAGFSEARKRGRRRVWRPVPNRSWHASGKGGIPSSREVFLLHFAD